MEARSVALIVDDEFLIRSLAVAVLEDAGFDVVEARNADDGLRILESHPDIRVVITDIEMPGSMDGLELGCTISSRWPWIEVVVTSGKWRPQADELPERSHFMAKPYSAAQLTDLLPGRL